MRISKNLFFGKRHTKETLELRKKWSKDRKLKRRGSGNPFFGKKHTKEAWEKTHAGFKRYVEKQRFLKELAEKGGNSLV